MATPEQVKNLELQLKQLQKEMDAQKAQYVNEIQNLKLENQKLRLENQIIRRDNPQAQSSLEDDPNLPTGPAPPDPNSKPFRLSKEQQNRLRPAKQIDFVYDPKQIEDIKLVQAPLYHSLENIAFTIHTSFIIRYFGDVVGDEDNIGCFHYCKVLQHIEIPDSLSSLYHRTFTRCEALETVVLPDNITSFGNTCFSCCKSLTALTLPRFMQSLGRSCFSHCISLVQLDLPNTINTIGNYCFQYCTALIQINKPTSLQTIGSDLWDRCDNLPQNMKF